MDLDMLKIGMSFTLTKKVEELHLASTWGSGGLPVFATPYLIACMELASLKAVSEALPSGVGTVGTKVDIEHLAPTPVGMEVTVSAELIAIDRRKLTFRVEAMDEREKIGVGIHERFVVEEEKFLIKTNGKL